MTVSGFHATTKAAFGLTASAVIAISFAGAAPAASAPSPAKPHHSAAPKATASASVRIVRDSWSSPDARRGTAGVRVQRDIKPCDDRSPSSSPSPGGRACVLMVSIIE